jgi:hypothetical protein
MRENNLDLKNTGSLQRHTGSVLFFVHQSLLCAFNIVVASSLLPLLN